MEKDPSSPVEVPVVLPLTEIDTPAKPAFSLAEITLPVIVRSWANNNVPKSNKGTVSKQLSLDISSDFIL